jgi:hypothetical protein
VLCALLFFCALLLRYCLPQVRRFGPAHRGDFIYSDYAHMDFVWDRNAKHAVDLVDVFFRYSPGTF